MNRMTRLRKNLQVLGRYCSAREALYGCLVREALRDLELVTDDGGKTLITAEYWAELHGGYEHDELLQHMAGVAMDTIRVSREPSELPERVG